MRSVVLVAALCLSAASVEAQRRQQMAPPPDHWMTLDSVVTAVGVAEAQRADVVKHYEGVNAVLKRAVDERRAMREKFEGLQKEIDTHYAALRELLTPEQQAKLDALPRPQVAMMGQRRPGRS